MGSDRPDMGSCPKGLPLFAPKSPEPLLDRRFPRDDENRMRVKGSPNLPEHTQTRPQTNETHIENAAAIP